LIITKPTKLHEYILKSFKGIEYKNVSITDIRRDGLRTLIEELKPTLVIIEADYYDRSTPYMMMCLLKAFPKLNIAAVNSHEYPEKKAVELIVNGVSSYLDKNEGMDEYIKGFLRIRDGKKYISPNIGKIIKLADKLPEPCKKITSRENEIVDLMCHGRHEEHIADRLEISVRTVRKHKENIYKSLNVDNKIDLFWAAFHAGLTSFDECSLLTA
jgi:DNA-binding NarL/FixJ family response regulator